MALFFQNKHLSLPLLFWKGVWVGIWVWVRSKEHDFCPKRVTRNRVKLYINGKVKRKKNSTEPDCAIAKNTFAKITRHSHDSIFITKCWNCFWHKQKFKIIIFLLNEYNPKIKIQQNIMFSMIVSFVNLINSKQIQVCF